jgi:addiction module RelE/StbE family toxin
LQAALDNLDAEAEYIAADDPKAARSVVSTIVAAIDHLTRHPSLGRRGRVNGTRELIIPNTPYIIPYRVRGDQIEILRVFHATRKWPKRL